MIPVIVRLIKKTKIYNFTLPTKIAGNYWITDNDYLGNTRNLINVEEENGKWKIKSDFETKIMSGEKEIESAYLKEYSFYFLKINTDSEYVILYCSPSVDPEIFKLKLKHDGEFIIGNDSKAHINYSYPLVSKQHTKLIYSNGSWSVQDLNSKYGTYANNLAVTSQSLSYGDVVFIMGLKIIVLYNSIVVNNIGDELRFDSNTFEIEEPLIQKQIEVDNPDEEGIEFFKEDDYFYRAPRFKTKIEPVDIKIDTPPGKEQEEKIPLIYTVGPMLTMSMMSVSMGFTSLNNVINGTADLSSALPSLIMAFAMLATMLLWPMLSKQFQKRQRRKREKLRQEKYTKYIETKRQEIQTAMKVQRQILIDNNLPLEETKDIIYSKRRNLWEREIDQDDFLDLRLGIGSTELAGTIGFPEEHFALETDNLLDEVYKLGAESRLLENVPISLSFIKNNISAIIGTGIHKKAFIEGLLLQIMTYHSYEDLKIVLFTNEKNAANWEYLKVLPHTWSNDHSIRYFATNLDEAKEISLALEQEIQARKYKDVNGDMQLNKVDYKNYSPYYLIITDDYKSVRDIELIKDVASEEVNIGFSMIAISPRLINLPNECKTFISVGDNKAGVFENELVSNKQKEFTPDYDPNLNIYECCKKLANIPIDIAKENHNLPTTLSFLEMYNVGMIEQLNILNRWKTNDPVKSLSAPVGVDKAHELFKLDLHEKFHGPHGLIAGMTGSGKSEFIITYVLSMALNYDPKEVQFVLIDYKGGGLAGAFENKETGMKLPHLAGTITNLDTIEMNRSLASIQSELRKRQRKFNEARDALNESTIDIYKYQDLYRKGLVKEPISHLFIISDEFAELKDQQPEFMDQLISTARIGRSLGVHLILATQKPAGVVNDQIWSNSKFRVCLKVQDKSDSMDMIKCPDAAAIKNPGRFYLQVGYNELFALGQSAWTGAQYYPTEKRKKKVDNSLDFIDDVGNNIRTLDVKTDIKPIESQGEEITNIIKYIIANAKNENIFVPKLWLDRIPNVIYVEELRKKYHYITEKNNINPIIGEYDDPDNQIQNALTLPLSTGGNTIIFGAAGAGKELMLTSIIYSTITTHDSSEVNFYIIDFGAETLTMFRNAPQVGDVLLSTDEEKLANLFKMINQTINERKKLFVEYNGSFDYYVHHSGKQIPMLVIIINNVEALFDTYEDYEDLIGQLTRDCLKYGIIFILSTNGPNTVRYRLRQNFSQNIVLQFNDPSDYGSVLAGVRKKEPSKVYGRGLIDLDGIFEFQTAYSYKEEHLIEYIKVICERLSGICSIKALPIPILPEVVTIDLLSRNLSTISSIPIGITKETLEVATIDLKKNYIYNITGDDISNSKKIVTGLSNLITKIPNNNTIIIDSQGLVTESDIHESLISLRDIYNGIVDAYQADPKSLANQMSTTCFIIGVASLISKLSLDEKNLFTNIITNAKKINCFHFIFVDTIDNIKGIAYEAWYKPNADLANGIWLGNGLSEQYTLKVITNSRLLRMEVTADFGYVITKGKADLVKFIGE